MIAPWMLYCVLCALGLSLAAVVAEQTLLAGRVPVRHVWTVAVLLSLVVPAVAYRVASRPTAIVVAAADDQAPGGPHACRFAGQHIARGRGSRSTDDATLELAIGVDAGRRAARHCVAHVVGGSHRALPVRNDRARVDAPMVAARHGAGSRRAGV